MSYTIEWDTEALSDLGLVWDRSSFKQRVAITDALTDLDRLLSARADTAGESRFHPSVRWVCVVPVSLTVLVSERLRVAKILEARVYKRKA